MIGRSLQFLFFLVFVRPIIYIVLGLNVRHWERLSGEGPAIIVANHNSHLDTLVLMSLLPLRAVHRLRPVAAADYFLRNKLLAWFALNIIGIVPIERQGKSGNKLAGSIEALERGDILILFPEGTRGEPESMNPDLKKGVSILAKQFPDVSVIPVFLHGLGKTLPKGTFIPIPFFCDVFVGEAMTYHDHEDAFMPRLQKSFERLSSEEALPEWK